MNEHLPTPPPEHALNEIYLWIVRTRDGGEGIIQSPLGRILIASSYENGMKQKPQAELAKGVAAKQGQFLEIELRGYIRKP